MTPEIVEAAITVALACVPPVAALLAALLWHLARKAGYDADGELQGRLEQAINASLSVAMAKMLPVIEARGWNGQDVMRGILLEAADYLRQRFPDRARDIATAARVTTDAAIRAAVVETISGRVPAAIAKAAASPASPGGAFPPDPFPAAQGGRPKGF